MIDSLNEKFHRLIQPRLVKYNDFVFPNPVDIFTQPKDNRLYSIPVLKIKPSDVQIIKIDENDAYSLNKTTGLDIELVNKRREMIILRKIIPHHTGKLANQGDIEFLSIIGPIVMSMIKHIEKTKGFTHLEPSVGDWYLSFSTPGRQNIYLRECENGDYELRIISNSIKMEYIYE